MKDPKQETHQIAGKADADSYGIKKYCDNCRVPILVYIPKGKMVDGFLGSAEGQALICNKCGCQAFPNDI